MELFAQASRLKLTFETPQGALSVNDLWDLPLTTNRNGRANLDDIAVSLNNQIQAAGTTSFVKKATRPNEILKAKFDVVLQVIEVLQAEADAAEVLRANAEKKQRVLEIIASKEDEALASKSLDELRELVGAL